MPDTFLDKFVSLTEDTEIPPEFALWSGLSAISCIMGRGIWIDMGIVTVFPNLFCILVAGSGRCRKSTAINLMESLVRSVEPRPNIIGQKITPEALIEALQQVSSGENIVLKGPKFEGFVLADELATFLNKKSYEAGMGSLLIQLYDCKDFFEYRTRGRGAEVLERTCLGLFGGSTIDWLRNAVPEDAIGGGLTSRMLFVYSDKPPQPVPFLTHSSKKKKTKEELIRALQRFQNIEGEMKLNTQAMKIYETEYIRFYHNNTFFDDKLLSGYASRRHIHILKLSMLFCISETEAKDVKVEHVNSAIRLIEYLEKSLPSVLKMVVASEKGDNLDTILLKIAKKGRLSRSDLMRSMSNKIDSWELEQIIETLKQSDKIVVKSEGRMVFYEIRKP